MAVVAVAAHRQAGLVGPGEAAAALGDLLALAPVADQLAVGRVLDGGQLVLLQQFGERLGRLVGGLVADGLQTVLAQAVGGGDAAGLEVALQHGNGIGAVVAGGADGGRQDQCRGQQDARRDVPLHWWSSFSA